MLSVLRVSQLGDIDPNPPVCDVIRAASHHVHKVRACWPLVLGARRPGLQQRVQPYIARPLCRAIKAEEAEQGRRRWRG
jgi:hypothetical protein